MSKQIPRRPERGPRQWQPVAPYVLSGWERDRAAYGVAGLMDADIDDALGDTENAR